jgi:hypothetical protein
LLFACPGPTNNPDGGTGGGSPGGGSNGGGNGGGSGGGSGGGTVDAGPPIDLAQACSKFAAAFCKRAERCKTIDVADDAACQALMQNNCTYSKDVNAGFARYDGAAAALCVAQLATDDCADQGAPAACGKIETGGFGKAGTPCTQSSDCQADAGFYCQFSFGCQVCKHTVGVGSFCSFDSDDECDPNLYCNDPNSDGGTCKTPAAAGQPCGIDSFTFNGFCDTGLYCNYMTADGGTACENPVANGKACMDSTACMTGSYCPTDTNMCTALLADGMPCSDPAACTSGYCNRVPNQNNDDFDAGTSRCGYLMNGDQCAWDPDCGKNSYCHGWVYKRADAGTIPGMCAATNPDGTACTDSATLAADSCSDSAATCLDNKCVVTPPFSRMLGQSCDTRGQCGNTTHCDFADPLTLEGHCQAAGNTGDKCYYDEDCALGSYCFYVDPTGDPNGTCTPLSKRGQVCDPGNFGAVDYGCQYVLSCVSDPDGGTGLCQPLVASGSMCDNTYGPLCYGSYCAVTSDAGTAGSCTAPGGIGTVCTGGSMCGSGNCTNPDGGFSDTTCQMACY